MLDPFQTCWRRCGAGRSLLNDRRGAVGLMIGLMMPVLIGFAALGVEAGLWFSTKRAMQTAADAAAVSAALELSGGGDSADVNAAANADAARNGTTGADEVTVNNPPASGAYTQDSSAVEVIVERSQNPLLSGMFLTEAFIIRARAVARGGGTPYAQCFLALDPDDADSAYLENNAELPETCGIAVNSNHANALRLKNNAQIHGTASVVGGYKLENNAGVATVQTGAAAAVDPYAGADPGALGSCSAAACVAKANKSVTLNPGRYCGGCDLGNNATVTLNPGTYFVEGQLKMQNNVTVNGTNVTFVLVDSAKLTLSNNAHINIKAPTSGALAGIAFMSETDAPYLEQKLTNNVHLAVTGAFYFPTQKLTIENNVNTPGGCTQFIAKNLHFKNNADLDNECEGTGVKSIGGGPVKLVE